VVRSSPRTVQPPVGSPIGQVTQPVLVTATGVLPTSQLPTGVVTQLPSSVAPLTVTAPSTVGLVGTNAPPLGARQGLTLGTGNVRLPVSTSGFNLPALQAVPGTTGILPQTTAVRSPPRSLSIGL
jgi:hypothetical protein